MEFSKSVAASRGAPVSVSLRRSRVSGGPARGWYLIIVPADRTSAKSVVSIANAQSRPSALSGQATKPSVRFDIAKVGNTPGGSLRCQCWQQSVLVPRPSRYLPRQQHPSQLLPARATVAYSENALRVVSAQATALAVVDEGNCCLRCYRRGGFRRAGDAPRRCIHSILGYFRWYLYSVEAHG